MEIHSKTISHYLNILKFYIKHHTVAVLHGCGVVSGKVFSAHRGSLNSTMCSKSCQGNKEYYSNIFHVVLERVTTGSGAIVNLNLV